MKKLFLCMLFVLFSVPLFCQSNVRNIYVGEEISLTFTAGRYYGDDYTFSLSSDAVELLSKKNFGANLSFTVRGKHAGTCVVSFSYTVYIDIYERTYTHEWIIHVTNGNLYITATPEDGIINPGTKVYLNTIYKGYQDHTGKPISGCDIYYTLDGSTPTKYSTQYNSSGISIEKNCRLRAIAFKYGYGDSPVFMKDFIIPVGDGTINNPYNITTIKQIASALNNNETSSNVYYFKGKVSYLTSYSNSCFDLSDDGENNDDFFINNANYLENTYYSSKYPSLKLGDCVVICGRLEKESQYTMRANDCYIYALNGYHTIDGKSTCSSIAHTGINGTTYRLQGNVKSISNSVYGNWYIEDSSGEIYIYGTKDKNGNSGKNNSIDDWGISVGDEISIEGPLVEYNNQRFLKDVTVLEVRQDRTIKPSSTGYATFYDAYKFFSLPNGCKAFVVTDVSEGKLVYKSLPNGVIPKGTAVMLHTSDAYSESIILNITTETDTYTGPNLLQGSSTKTTTFGDGYHYKLCYGSSGSLNEYLFSWYWGAQNGAPFEIERNKAWLVLPYNNHARQFNLPSDELSSEDASSAFSSHTTHIYDLQGRPIQNIPQKGVYIKDGKRFIK